MIGVPPVAREQAGWKKYAGKNAPEKIRLSGVKSNTGLQYR
jgi:hypothetical protein